MSKQLTIGEVARILRVSMDTLRRWDKSGILTAERADEKDGYRYYSYESIESYLNNNLFEVGYKWAANRTGSEPPEMFYCQNSSIFQARLAKMESEFITADSLKEIFSLLVAITGEIGNNAFDHNLGNWPDIPGLFFGYDLKSKQIVLADRGQGVYKTLKRVKPGLTDDSDALKTAFTEILSGRSPESRGNGLKFVRRIVGMIPIELLFQSGDAEINLDKNNLDMVYVITYNIGNKTAVNFLTTFAMMKNSFKIISQPAALPAESPAETPTETPLNP